MTRVGWVVFLVATTGCLFKPELYTGSADCSPTLHDEDLDGRVDVCDNCPGMVNANQLDGDGDGVGDACDPRPADADDAILAFLAFDDPTTLSDWQTTQGNWVISDDAYISNSGVTMGAIEEITQWTGGSWDAPLALEVAVTVDAIGNSGSEKYKFAIDLAHTYPIDEQTCEFLRDSGGDKVNVYSSLLGSRSALLTSSHLDVGAGYRMRLDVRARAATCLVVGDAGDAGMATNNLAADAVTMVHPIMFTTNVGVHVHYLNVYRLGA